jgi:NADH:ubiquinone oxidoreductase subunit 3 (subunit A)
MQPPSALLIIPPVAFVVFLALAFGILLWAKSIAPRTTPTGGRIEPYACGEDLPPVAIRPNYRQFFFVAVTFTIIHVAALVIATLPNGPSAACLGLVYLAVVLFSVVAIFIEAGARVSDDEPAAGHEPAAGKGGTH